MAAPVFEVMGLLVVSAEFSDEIVAYVDTAEFDGDLLATGRRQAYVASVGTLHGHRGKGLATALLGHACTPTGKPGTTRIPGRGLG